ncbi:S-adenosyl-L-methionine-dependent methyltransferase [Gorgonomyces haynaldii]|nr:S-adenosyl-L-methionine-dependent methyltransferase [Gorgonomyces haynaldii]
MNIFDKALKRIHRNKSRHFQLDYLRNEIADRIADRFLDLNRRTPKILDFMAGSGTMTQYLSKDICDQVVLMDSCADLLNSKKLQADFDIQRMLGDEENIPIGDDTFDAVVSNLQMHWINDLPRALTEIQRVLKPDGVFIGSLFGNDTLYELRSSLQLCEQERTGGISMHTSPMARTQDLGSLLSRAKFQLTTVDIDEIVVHYPSMFELMDDLGKMGESNALLQRKPYLSREVFYAAASAYKEIYGKPDGSIPATFQILYMIGWKPHVSQPKPLDRGSASKSLKEVL